ncbi:putative NADPH-quinone reductase [Mucilaginibacter sp. SG538B]|jgi:putative NADPH-quinone reductase|uniref:NAD(P)H-dependent oxidoreductase n=1 Tax=Mucilaginibacter TaxID=423349 RepID=UPI000871B0F3|nr:MULTISPECIES: NAD(P)H-dependent oxidoreductase [unclassified Mucilaginibacter]NVM62269.1 putative NADPH-quinone reductase [Mucilaginibacter sp. SG538B]SCW74281.1 Putative NADPH-quinone reductase (modulator of drug activity B) [Mucilaginibacter sp. NFR10]
MFALMRQLLIINADIDKTPTTAALINAYKDGAQAAEAVVKEIAIADLKFNPNKQFTLSNNEPEPDLVQAVNAIKWASHVVIFCPVYKDSINSKIKGFFDRVFMPDQVFISGSSVNFNGRSGRVVSILDEAAWQDWQVDMKPTYLAVKKLTLEKRGIKPVHTSTIGHLYNLDNEYSKKWIQKLYSFGLKLI